MAQSLPVIEVYKSIQGESSLAGLPCTFVRTAGCNLRCSYCDSRYAAEGRGRRVALRDIVRRVESEGTRLVCVTGGEPLIHPEATSLCRSLAQGGHTVVVETNGTQDISRLPPGLIRVMDVKCPGSGECGRTLEGNLERLESRDQVKFVISDRADFRWSVRFVRQQGLLEVCEVLFAPAYGRVSGGSLARWILGSGLDVRLQLQLHKILWPERHRCI